MLISVYTNGNLSHEEDKLVAISGLATRFKGLLQDAEYLAGLWKWNLVHQLLWETSPESVNGRTFSQRPKKYRAPSWSWASVDGEIVPWWPASNQRTKYHVFSKVLDVSVTAVNNDPFGQVKDGNLKIRGPLVVATLYRDEVPASHWDNFFVVPNGEKAESVRISVYPDITQSANVHHTHQDVEAYMEITDPPENPLQNLGALGPEIIYAIAGPIIFLSIRAKISERGAFFDLEGLILEDNWLEMLDGKKKVSETNRQV
jgi:hypothetical protein